MRLSPSLGMAVLAASALLQPASALDITPHETDAPDHRAILLKGQIERGDLLSLQAYISKLPETKLVTVYLDSTGGQLQEGMALGRFFYDAKLRTVVQSKTRCLSSCGLAFLGGRDAETGQPWRLKYSTGSIGYHWFVRRHPEKPEYNDKDMSEALANAQRTILQVAEYIQGIREDLTFLRLMLKGSENRMNYVSNEEALNLNISIFDERSGQIIDPKVIVKRLR